MIFVTVGTQDWSFKRLIEAVEKAVIDKKITDEVIIQAGNTKYESEYVKILNYIPFEEFASFMEKADIIITHGGVGSILNAVKLGKKVIAVPRLAKYNEHVNDHQLQVIRKMTDDGYILSTEDETLIVDKIKEIANFEPKVYTSNTDNFVKGVKNILDEIINS